MNAMEEEQQKVMIHKNATHVEGADRSTIGIRILK